MASGKMLRGLDNAIQPHAGRPLMIDRCIGHGDDSSRKPPTEHPGRQKDLLIRHPECGLKPFAGFHYAYALPAAGPFSRSFWGWGHYGGSGRAHLSLIPTVAVILRARSSAVGLKARGPSLEDQRFAIFYLAGSTEVSAYCIPDFVPSTAHCRNISVAMDYSYFSAQQQPYHFLGLSSDGFPHSGVDPETIRSVVRSFQRCWSRTVAPHFSLVDRTMTNPNTT
jgi:hypothetical protein